MKALGLHFLLPKAHCHQAVAGLHSFEICSQRGVNGLEPLSTSWTDLLRGRGEKIELLPGVDSTTPHLCDSKEASLCRTSSFECRLNTQCAPLSPCSRKMCKQFDKAECRLNSLHAAGFSHGQILSILGKQQRAGLLPGCHCRKTHAALPLTCKFCKLWGEVLRLSTEDKSRKTTGWNVGFGLGCLVLIFFFSYLYQSVPMSICIYISKSISVSISTSICIYT